MARRKKITDLEELKKELYKMFSQQSDDIAYVRRKLTWAKRLNRQECDRWLQEKSMANRHAITDEEAAEYKAFLAESYGSALKSAALILRTEVALSRDENLIGSMKIRVEEEVEDESAEVEEKRTAELAQKLMAEVIN